MVCSAQTAMASQGRKRDDCLLSVAGDICEPEKVEVAVKNAALSDSDSPIIDEKNPISISTNNCTGSTNNCTGSTNNCTGFCTDCLHPARAAGYWPSLGGSLEVTE